MVWHCFGQDQSTAPIPLPRGAPAPPLKNLELLIRISPRVEKKHLQLNNSFYEKLAYKYSDIENKKIGLSVSNLDSIENIIEFNFDFFKILSIAAKDEILINTLLDKTKAIS